ncbi:MAG: Hsp70 family protein [Acidobacteriota bacterium]
MSKFWAIDLGTTNSLVARWNDVTDEPEMVSLPEICRRLPESSSQLQIPSLVPSCVLFPPARRFRDRLGSHPLLLKRFFIGKQAIIGQPAIDHWVSRSATGFVPVFKPYLGRESLRVLARARRRPVTTRQTAAAFMRELLAAVTAATKERPREVVFTTPVDSYEPYRAELKAIAERLGIRRFRTLDEPVAAALGYGVGRGDPSTVLAINFGGGTFDAAVIELDRDSLSSGSCRVIAKEGIPMGGNLVDAWLVEGFCNKLGYDLRNAIAPGAPGSQASRMEWWYQALTREACRVKESLYTRPQERFLVIPPEDMRRLDAACDARAEVDFTREDLTELLTRNGLYRAIDTVVDRVIEQAAAQGVKSEDVEDVIMVGGSTLLPEVYSRIAARFGRDRMRAWQPFEAVAFGGCIFAAGAIEPTDVILHDYAFVTYDRKTHEPEYQIIVPQGTRIPTAEPVWRRHVTPTCPLGEPERIYKLVICEMGRAHDDHRRFVWDQSGRLHTVGGEQKQKTVIVPLNEANPTMGYLEPPHHPRERAARLEIEFAVNEDRWLTASVFDLKVRKHLMVEEPVVRLQ